MKCVIKGKRKLSEWENRKLKEEFKNMFFAYDLEYLFMSSDNK